MAEFFGLLRVLVICGTLLFLAMLVLLSLPASRLRTVGLELLKYAAAAGLVLLIPSPIDIAPDAIPVIGWLDDIGYIVAAVASVRSGLGERKKRLIYDEIEMAELRQRAKGAGDVHSQN